MGALWLRNATRKARYMRNIQMYDPCLKVAGLQSSIGNINPNPVGLPSEAAWPMKNLPLSKSGSAWQSREKWLQYVEPRLSKSSLSEQTSFKSVGGISYYRIGGTSKPRSTITLFRSHGKSLKDRQSGRSADTDAPATSGRKQRRTALQLLRQ